MTECFGDIPTANKIKTGSVPLLKYTLAEELAL